MSFGCADVVEGDAGAPAESSGTAPATGIVNRDRSGSIDPVQHDGNDQVT